MSTEISAYSMNLNSVDSGDVRHLLMELARALTTIANPTSIATTSALFLNRRFVPPQDFPTALYERHPVQILMKLHAVQDEVEKWVGASELQEVQVPALNQEGEQEILERGRSPQTKEVPSKTTPTEVRAQKNPSISPLIKEARELVHQVQEAIAKLSSSTSLQYASQALLRDALKRLKPGLDRIILTINEAQQQKPSEKGEQLPKEIRAPSLPTPARQQVVMQSLREPRKERVQPEEVATDKLVKKATAQQTPDPEEMQLQSISKNHKERRVPKLVKENQELQKEHQIERSMYSTRSEKQEPGQKNTHSEIKPVALPISPLIFETKKITAARKKKKRKGFWFKDEEDTK
jgi:hypothetical protein